MKPIEAFACAVIDTHIATVRFAHWVRSRPERWAGAWFGYRCSKGCGQRTRCQADHNLREHAGDPA